MCVPVLEYCIVAGCPNSARTAETADLVAARSLAGYSVPCALRPPPSRSREWDRSILQHRPQRTKHLAHVHTHHVHAHAHVHEHPVADCLRLVARVVVRVTPLTPARS